MTPWIWTKRSQTIGLPMTRYLFAFGLCPSTPRLRRMSLSTPSSPSWPSLEELLVSFLDFHLWPFGMAWWVWRNGWLNGRQISNKYRDPVQLKCKLLLCQTSKQQKIQTTRFHECIFSYSQAGLAVRKGRERIDKAPRLSIRAVISIFLSDTIGMCLSGGGPQPAQNSLLFVLSLKHGCFPQKRNV